MLSPYINTKLHTIVTIQPNQMNNDIYTHMKNNLIERLEGKCYRNYGYISKIYEILERSDGMIEPENPMAAALYNVKISCRLCIPLKNRYIICRVDKISSMLTCVLNGPIKVMITNERINKEKFTLGKTGIVVKTTNGGKLLQRGDYVKVKIDAKKFNDRDEVIMCIGILESMATPEEITLYSKDEYNVNDKYVDYEKYIKLEDEKSNIENVGEDANEDERNVGPSIKEISTTNLI